MPATNPSMVGKKKTARKNCRVMDEQYRYRITLWVGELCYYFSPTRGGFTTESRHAQIFDTEALAQAKADKISHEQAHYLNRFPLYVQPEVEFVRADELKGDVQLSLFSGGVNV